MIEKEKWTEPGRLQAANRFLISCLSGKKVGIVTTGSEVKKGLIQDTFTPVLREKLAEYSCQVMGQTTPGDEKDQITGDILKFIENGADMVICSGGMSVDPDDRTPGAIRATGAENRNLWSSGSSEPCFFLPTTERGKTIPILGLPGCVMYAKRTVFDLVLPRIVADDPVRRKKLQPMGRADFA